jgi:hypothetical protein
MPTPPHTKTPLLPKGPSLDDGLASVRGLRLPLLAATAYVAAVSVWFEQGRSAVAWACAAVALAIAHRGGRLRPLDALAHLGLAVVVAASGTSGDPPNAELFATLGAALSAFVAHAYAIGIESPPSIVRAARPEPLTAFFGWTGLTVAWGLAIASAVSRAVGAFHVLTFRVLPNLYFAASATIVVLTFALLTNGERRRFELSVPTRARAALGLVAFVTAAAGLLILTRVAPPERVLRAAIAAFVPVLGLACVTADAVLVALLARRTVALLAFGGAAVTPSVMIMAERLVDPTVAVALAFASALVVGALAPRLEAPLRPASGAWLDAIGRAHHAIERLDADDALREALMALREPAGLAATSPEIWTLEPSRVRTIDAAGYAHEREAALPALLVDVASAEPEATLRTDVLAALEVRRPDLRPLLRWMEDRDALCAALVTREGEVEGVLVVPRGPWRTAPLTLEEVRALKGLADALAGVLSSRATIARSLEREREAVLRAERAEEAQLRLEHRHALDRGRHRLAARRLARPATIGIYSASSRMAFEAIERRVVAQAPLAIVAPSGVDPVPYIARAHLAGPRADAPLVLVDGTSAREHELERWRHRRESPLALADGGALVLLDAAALPHAVQRLVARALAERRAPWERPEPIDLMLVVTGVSSPRVLLSEGRLDDALARRLGDAFASPIELPRLRDRPDDIRAILIDRFAREGLRVRGEPVGVEAAALVRLIELTFDGEDAELQSLVQRLVAIADGPLVRAAHVAALGLPEDASTAPSQKSPLTA